MKICSFSNKYVVGQENVPQTLYGFKGAGLIEMARYGIPVPPGFVIPTDHCRDFLKTGRLAENFLEKLTPHLQEIQEITGRKFDDPNNPLLVSVRSGAEMFMPGMMDTVLYIGLNQLTAEGLPKSLADRCLKRLQDKVGRLGQDFPVGTMSQLETAIRRIFLSWESSQSKDYRRLHGIPDHLGTACTIQAMVFGDWNERSGSGVAFTRNPDSGEKIVTGEFVHQLPGEVLVSGQVVPESLTRFQEVAPEAYQQLIQTAHQVESIFKDMCVIEFTVEDGRLWILQCMPAPRSGRAALKVGIDLLEREKITDVELIGRINPHDIAHLHLAQLAPHTISPNGQGIPASSGVVCGPAIFLPDQVKNYPSAILVRQQPDSDDIRVLPTLGGLLTALGGSGSHFSVIARNNKLPAVVGCQNLKVTEHGATLGGQAIELGQKITICGTTGQVFLKEMPIIKAEPPKELDTFLALCDQKRKTPIFAFADSLAEVKQAKTLGVQVAISTERIFSGENRDLLLGVIVPETTDQRVGAEETLFNQQLNCFTEIFRVMNGQVVIIRLLDPPLHEFLPKDHPAYRQVNPLLGHRGCRLMSTHPQLYELQLRAIFRAAHDMNEQGSSCQPRVLVPMISTVNEFCQIRDLVRRVADTERFFGDYQIGSMIETPRAALLGRELGQEMDFAAIGLMDLTQCVFGMSRDDTGYFATHYQINRLWEHDPFTALDQAGVGRLLSIFIQDVHQVKPELPIALTAWDKDSIRFALSKLEKYGQIVCPISTVPLVKLVTAQMALQYSF